MILMRQDGGFTGVNIGFNEASFGENKFGVSRRYNNTNYWDVLVVDTSNGNIGIGTNNSSEKLSVNGTIRSKEIKVEATPWPDYVFAEDYTLKSLEETEAYIKENKRLPDMPSAEEVAENGIALGEMNRLLLEKVEELTLYIIHQQKEIDAIKMQMKD